MRKIYIKANITVKVAGISGGFKETISYIVNAHSPKHARTRFEEKIRADKAHTIPESITFEYLEIADEI